MSLMQLQRVDFSIGGPLLLEPVSYTHLDVYKRQEEERVRLHKAVASIFHPEPKLRRKKSKELERERHAEKLRRADALPDQTGIRALRRAPVFTLSLIHI